MTLQIILRHALRHLERAFYKLNCVKLTLFPHFIGKTDTKWCVMRNDLKYHLCLGDVNATGPKGFNFDWNFCKRTILRLLSFHVVY